MNVTVTDHPDRHRYEIHVDGELAGYGEYRARPGLIAFIHTEIEDRFQHQGLAERLVSEMLDDARARGLEVLPFCPFVRAFIQGHREYASLVPKDRWGAFEL